MNSVCQDFNRALGERFFVLLAACSAVIAKSECRRILLFLVVLFLSSNVSEVTDMRIISRSVNEGLVIDGDVRVTVLEIQHNRV